MRRIISTVILALFLSVGFAEAQTYPNKPIKLIVPFVPGGPVDSLGRVVVQHLEGRLGQTIVVENRPGGGTTIGAKALAASPPDGYTLLLIGPNMGYYPVLFPKVEFEPTKALAPVAPLVTWSHILNVAPAVPAKTVTELVAYAKANPGKVAFGYGLGTMPHILGASFKNLTQIDIVDVSYRGGEQARADLLGGRVHINISPVPQVAPLVQAGKLRPIAYTGAQRSPDLPNVPTMIESGFPQVGFYPDVWMGIFAPAGTPAEIVDKLNQAINATMKSAEMAPSLKRFGYEAKIMTPKEFSAFFAADLQKWPPRLRAAGMKGQ